MPQTATINPNMEDMIGLHHIINQSIAEQDFDDPLTVEEEKAVVIAEAQIARGEYDVMRHDESLTDFLKRLGKID